MSRYVLAQGHAHDGNGKIIPSASVQIYQADTTTAPTNMWTVKSGGTAITTGQVTADADGYFIVYVDDGTYALGTEFDLLISKEGYDTITYADIRG